MQPSYETVYILKPDLTEEGVKKIHDKVADWVARRGGKVLHHRELGKRPLAYRIGRQTKGHYFQINFEGNGPVIDDLEKNLRLSEDCLRFLTVRVPLTREENAS